jgi:hypothetical protein
MSLTTAERAAIRNYKNAASRLPKYNVLSSYALPDFSATQFSSSELLNVPKEKLSDEDRGLLVDDLTEYLNIARTYVFTLYGAAKAREHHYQKFVHGSRYEDPGHRAWRLGMNMMAINGKKKIKVWELCLNTHFDKLPCADYEFESEIFAMDSRAYLWGTSDIADIVDGDFYEPPPNKTVKTCALSAGEKKRRARRRAAERKKRENEVEQMFRDAAERNTPAVVKLWNMKRVAHELTYSLKSFRACPIRPFLIYRDDKIIGTDEEMEILFRAVLESQIFDMTLSSYLVLYNLRKSSYIVSLAQKEISQAINDLFTFSGTDKVLQFNKVCSLLLILPEEYVAVSLKLLDTRNKTWVHAMRSMYISILSSMPAISFCFLLMCTDPVYSSLLEDYVAISAKKYNSTLTGKLAIAMGHSNGRLGDSEAKSVGLHLESSESKLMARESEKIYRMIFHYRNSENGPAINVLGRNPISSREKKWEENIVLSKGFILLCRDQSGIVVQKLESKHELSSEKLRKEAYEDYKDKDIVLPGPVFFKYTKLAKLI